MARGHLRRRLRPVVQRRQPRPMHQPGVLLARPVAALPEVPGGSPGARARPAHRGGAGRGARERDRLGLQHAPAHRLPQRHRQQLVDSARQGLAVPGQAPVHELGHAGWGLLFGRCPHPLACCAGLPVVSRCSHTLVRRARQVRGHLGGQGVREQVVRFLAKAGPEQGARGQGCPCHSRQGQRSPDARAARHLQDRAIRLHCTGKQRLGRAPGCDNAPSAAGGDEAVHEPEVARLPCRHLLRELREPAVLRPGPGGRRGRHARRPRVAAPAPRGGLGHSQQGRGRRARA
mmetsp:Transcript_32571/g.93404  ORF Transcript_32571/g.93404 Transcript_32571/m.93404 type:complete len:289 (-) Transcript_32571:230-1096(-)